MDIDLLQLPIPNWGLHCPNCNYALAGLPGHRCPECGTEFDITELVTTWTRLRPPAFTGHEQPWPDFGFDCRGCGTPLHGARDFTCGVCGRRFDPEALRPASEWFVLGSDLTCELPMPGVQALLAAELVPYQPVQERTIREIYGGHGITFARLRVPSEFFFDVCHLLTRARVEIARNRAIAETHDWACASCGEVNPGHFELCWNCGAEGGGG